MERGSADLLRERTCSREVAGWREAADKIPVSGARWFCGRIDESDLSPFLGVVESRLVEAVKLLTLREKVKSSLNDILTNAVPFRQILTDPIGLDIDGVGPAEFPAPPTGSRFKLMFEYTVTEEGQFTLRMEYHTPELSDSMVN
ncbi:hypothetical protein B0T14DRAFT_564204 [Immersiella caudata]|uniref:Uncharacterized protein n=1 Tax=Immersiella caudata TaxID=314043 RepID=A0AA39WWZ2_9PEZI|nr:hypothetical protein B0T14DRAFT_564204 [Immersiella caudata]